MNLKKHSLYSIPQPVPLKNYHEADCHMESFEYKNDAMSTQYAMFHVFFVHYFFVFNLVECILCGILLCRKMFTDSTEHHYGNHTVAQ